MATDRRNATSEDLKNEVLEKITHYTNDGFPEAAKLHSIIMAAAPSLCPRLWYGMPGYAKTKDSPVLCFFRKDAHITFGFTEAVDLSVFSDGKKTLVPSAWYVTELNEDAESEITETVKKVV